MLGKKENMEQVHWRGKNTISYTFQFSGESQYILKSHKNPGTEIFKAIASEWYLHLESAFHLFALILPSLCENYQP